MLKAFLIALQFLTRIPVHLRDDQGNHAIGQSILFYPLVGLIIGTLLALISNFLNGLLSIHLHAALLLGVWILITGALHLDGLADSADAWLGGHGNRQKTLEIMKDPRCGPAAVIILVMLLLIKFSALHSLISTQHWQYLLIIPVVSRSALLLLFLTTPYRRKHGLGEILAAHLPRTKSWIVVGVVGVTIITLVDGGLWMLIILLLSFAGLRWLMMQRIEGFTGDTAGAMVEILETTLLVGATLAGGFNLFFLT